jgi:ribosome biogenesis GTPase A
MRHDVGVIDAIVRKRGCLLAGSSGGQDRDKAERILFADFRDGTLGRTSLETSGTAEETRSGRSGARSSKHPRLVVCEVT